MKYSVVGPDGRTYFNTDDWLQGLDQSVVLSVRHGGEFHVVSLHGILPFSRERNRCVAAARELVKTFRGGLDTTYDKWRYALRREQLQHLTDASLEWHGTEFLERCLRKSHFPAVPTR